MDINLKGGGHEVIRDTDPRAIKIREGYEYEFNENGELTVSDRKTGRDIETILPKLKLGTATAAELQKVLAFLLSKHLESGKI